MATARGQSCCHVSNRSDLSLSAIGSLWLVCSAALTPCEPNKMPLTSTHYTSLHTHTHTHSFTVVCGLLTLFLHIQVALHRVLADTLVFMWILLHLPHQTLNLRPRALKTVPRLPTKAHRSADLSSEIQLVDGKVHNKPYMLQNEQVLKAYFKAASWESLV